MKAFVFIFILSFSISFVMASEMKEVEKEALIFSSEKKAIQEVNRLLKRHSGTALEAELRLRKAELFVRRSQSSRFFEFFLEDTGTGKKNRSLITKSFLSKKSISWLNQAITQFDQLERKFPKFNKRDLVLFKIGFHSQQLGRDEFALHQYKRMLQQYPSSSYRIDAELAIGEIYYSMAKYREASDYYESVIKRKDEKVHAMALYKNAWSYYNLQKTDIAMENLKDLISWESKKEVFQQNLLAEARNDMALFYADRNIKEDTYRFFKLWGGVYFEKYLYRLGLLYKHYNKNSKMQEIYREVIEKGSLNSSVVQVFTALIKYYNSSVKFSESDKYIKKFSKQCPVDNAECSEPVKKLSLESAVKRHKLLKDARFSTDLKINGHSVNSNELIEQSADAYRIYLQRQIDIPAKQKVRFQLAELLFSSKKYLAASKEYEAVAKKSINQKMIHDATYSALVSLEKSVENKPREKIWSSADEKRFFSLVEIYYRHSPKGTFIYDLMYKKAQILLLRKKDTLALKEFKKLGDEKSQNKKVLEAQDVWIRLKLAGKNYSEVAKASEIWSTSAEPDKRASSLKKISLQAEFSSIEEDVSNKKIDQAISRYKKFARKYKKSSLADKAWWNALQLVRGKAADIEFAQMAELLPVLFADSKYKEKCIQLAISAYQNLGDLEKSAMLIEKYLEVFEDKSTWLSLAIELYNSSGNEKSEARLLQLGQTSEKESVRYESLKRLSSEHFLDIKERKKAIQKMMADRSSRIRALGFLLAAEKDFKEKKYKDSFSRSLKVTSLRKVEAEIWARARWIQAQVLKREYERQSVRSSAVERIPLVLQLKVGKLQKAQKAMQSVLMKSDPRLSVLVLKSMAEMTSGFLKTIKSFPLPSDINEVDRKTLQAEFDKMALPLEDQVAETYEKAISLSEKKHVFLGQQKKIRNALRTLNYQGNLEADVEVRAESPLIPIWEPQS